VAVYLPDSIRIRIRERIEAIVAAGRAQYMDTEFELFNEFKGALNAGQIRAAEKENGKWRVNTWVKQGILLGFRMGELTEMSANSFLRFFDKNTSNGIFCCLKGSVNAQSLNTPLLESLPCTITTGGSGFKTD
jgi:hypothetical protein